MLFGRIYNFTIIWCFRVCQEKIRIKNGRTLINQKPCPVKGRRKAASCNSGQFKPCRALRRLGADKQYIDEYVSRATSDDYDHLLAIAMGYVEVK